VLNLFIDRANIGDKKSWHATFGFENKKNLAALPLIVTYKGHFLSK
jgi:hypothetical protein